MFLLIGSKQNASRAAGSMVSREQPLAYLLCLVCDDGG